MSSPAFLTHGATLALAWFALVNAAVSLTIALAAGRLLRGSAPQSPTAWFALRLLPALSSIFFVVLFFLPSYWQYEPRETVEGFDWASTIAATLTVTILAAAAARGLAALWSARQRVQTWLRGARPVRFANTTVPAYEVDADQPIIALTGLFRPRLLVTRGFLSALSETEISASVAHELGHFRALDNLKRLAMRAAPDLLYGSAVARAIEQRWMSSAEHAADRTADSAESRCALASALVKVARLTPVMHATSEPISTLIGGGEIASRVRALLADAPVARRRSLARRCAATLPVLAGAAAAYTPILHAVHEATEVLVRLLP